MAKDLDKLFNDIITDISECGKPVIDALKGRMSTKTFYELLNKDEEKVKTYARACEMRADLMAEEILEIADNIGGDMITLKDGREVVDNAVVQRDRLRVDSRKWLLAKLHPKKYGDKIDVTSDNKSIAAQPTIIVDSNETATELKKLISGGETNKDIPA